MKTLKVTVKEHGFLDDDVDHRLDSIHGHGSRQHPQPVLRFSSYTGLNRLVNPLNLELLETLAQESPSDPSELADMLDREPKHVHRNLRELEKIGVVTSDAGVDGRVTNPRSKYDGFDIDIPLTEPRR